MHDVGAVPDLLIASRQHVGACPVPVMLARQTKEGPYPFDVLLDPGAQSRIARRPFGKPCGEIAAIVESAELLQAVVAMLPRQMVEGIPEEMRIGAVDEVSCC